VLVEVGSERAVMATRVRSRLHLFPFLADFVLAGLFVHLQLSSRRSFKRLQKA
jgi:hypothetical protein